MLGTVDTYEGVVVDAGGREDDIEEAEETGGSGDAQLEPGPENRFWHVVGSHQAGPVSHCGKGEVRCGRRCL